MTYRETLDRLEGLVTQAEWVVPGHGGPISGEAALIVLGEDRAYLDALTSDGDAAALPEGRRDAVQRRLHAREPDQSSFLIDAGGGRPRGG